MVRYDTARFMFAVAAQFGLVGKQFDFKTAFLYGKLEERIYVRIPEGVDVRPEEGDCVLLEKSIYGLKQAPRCWRSRVLEAL